MSFRVLALGALIGSLAGAQAFSGAAAVDAVIEKAVRDQLIPGAVLIAGHDGKVIYRKAYGSRALVPEREPMTLDTIFDAASLTKVIATTTCLMNLVETGKVRLNDRVTEYLPEFQGGKSEITIRQLMTHFSGLRPDLDMPPAWRGYDTGLKLALADQPVNRPDAKFVYSDINFILLGEIVHRVSGQTLADFAREKVFAPLGMRHSTFQPPAEWKPLIAPTEVENGIVVRGAVHDPTARAMEGIAGHAGLFTTADDLARFAQMMLNSGELDGVRIASPLTIRKFTTPQTPPNQPILRGLGWDIDSPFSSNRGDLYPVGSFGHTGFTGTSIWIDPSTRSYVILLANSVHPSRGKSLTGLRGRVATIVAAAVGATGVGAKPRRPRAEGGVRTGIDVLAASNFAELRGKRVGLFTNHTGVTRDGKRNLDVMVAAGVKVTAIFSPEHGLAGKEDNEKVQSTVDAATGITVHSLYLASRRRPTPEMLKNVDVLVFDIQDVGARFYTYSCSMLYALEEAARNKIPFLVLDRPNPVTGEHVEGPMIDRNLESFVGCFEMPVRHGMTFGELAGMMNGERKIGADLRVVKVEGWERGDWFDATGLPWVNPSPNMPGLNSATLYTGVALLEYAKNYSVGRGTAVAFEQIGTDWINGRQLAEYLNGRGIEGVRAYPVRFRPESSNFAHTEIEGVRFVITGRDQLDSVRLGIEIACALEKLYPGKMNFEANKLLIGNREVIDALRKGADPQSIVRSWERPLAAFSDVRRQYLLY